MRHAVIRKKRLKVERAYLDFINQPMRFVSGVNINTPDKLDLDAIISSMQRDNLATLIM